MPNPPSELTSPICYLCGNPITSNQGDDHVPPKQFFPSDLRRLASPNLRKLPTHKACNQAYQRDEDYFVHTTGSARQGTTALNHLWNDLARSLKRPHAQGLGRRIHAEFSKITPGGIHLPGELMVKTFDVERVHRIVWKIVRGLHFLEFGTILPETTPHTIQRHQEGSSLSLLPLVSGEPSREERFPGVFDYKYKHFEFEPSQTTFLWGLLFWDEFPFVVIQHTIDCSCPHCMEKPTGNIEETNV